MYDPNAVKIYTDGSAKPNPGQGGIGVVAEYPDGIDLDNYELSEGYLLSTNNHMELKAIIRALEWLQETSSAHRFSRAIIITDSEYVYSNYNNVQYWKKDGWRSKDGRPYENPELWDSFLKERQKTKLPIEIHWEKGKQNEKLLRVDTLAKQGADHPTMTDSGYNAGKFTAPRTPSKKAATLFPAEGQEAIIRVYRSVVLGRNERQIYKVTFDLYDEDSETYVSKHVAYTKLSPELKRNNCYMATFNRSSRFPKILTVEELEYLKGS